MKGRYSQMSIDRVRDAALMADHIPDIKTSGRTLYAKCPECGACGKVKGKLKGLKITDVGKKHIAKCFDCGFSFGDAIKAEMHYSGDDFKTALERCAAMANVTIETEESRVDKFVSETSDSFMAQQLAASGLSTGDVIARVRDKNGDFVLESPFRRGSVDARGVINPNHDEMLIYYYDLYGNQVYYSASSRGNPSRPYVRVRWSVPSLHLDKNGKGTKYQTPFGAKARFYIPQKIRDAFENKTPIETLVIQEGEKKAEKACKHGIMSLGIQGIYNIGTAQTGVFSELQYIIQACDVKNVVLLFDADWDDISSKCTNGDYVDRRPKQFANAAVKFRQYVQSLLAKGINIDVWIGHINSDRDKGIDDLLQNTLKCHEDEFVEDLRRAMLAHDGRGTYVDCHKVSTYSDFKIFDLFGLNSFETFFERHREQLEKLEVFTFANVVYGRNKDGNYEAKTETGASSQFWDVEYNDNGKKKITFSRIRISDFLASNKFRVVSSLESGNEPNMMAQLNGSILHKVCYMDIKRFVYNWVRSNCKDSDVPDSLLAQLSSIVSLDVVGTLPLIEYEPPTPSKDRQTFPFKNGFVSVTADGITVDPIGAVVWDHDVINREFKRTPVFESLEWGETGPRFQDTEESLNCEFLSFLKNTCNFWGDDIMKPENQKIWLLHLANKMSCIGYLLHAYKDFAQTKAVIAMDGTMSEVGKSNGRSGKSMIALALKQLCRQETIEGRNLSAGDAFMFTNIDTSTRVVLFDDIRVNFDFNSLFTILTGDFTVNVKNGGRFVIPFDKSPKILLTTNHAISADDDSTNARRVLMSFSNYYNVDYTPTDDFGHTFFQHWDDLQWQLFDNFMLECLMMHLKAKEQGWCGSASGIIEPPMVDLRQRQLRQIMGEDFLMWAEEVYGESGSNLGYRIKRRELYDKCCKDNPGLSKYLTPRNFYDRLKAFAEFKGLSVNPTKPRVKTDESYEQWKLAGGEGVFIGVPDKSNSIEYITLSADGTARWPVF